MPISKNPDMNYFLDKQFYVFQLLDNNLKNHDRR